MSSENERPPSDSSTDGSRSPGVAGDPRERSPVTDPAGKTWFRDLDEAVIEADRCIQCGTCVAACPSDSIGIDEETERPTLVRMCTGCSRCWDYCPRSGLRYERLIDLLEAERGFAPVTYAAKAREDDAQAAGQDGGAVTTLLAELLETGTLDGALVAVESDDRPLHGDAYLATSREDLLAAAGSAYNQTMQLGNLEELIASEDDLGDDPAIALVGTPCVIEGAAALERYDDPVTESIALTVALMCTRSFEYDRLISTLVDFDVAPDAVASIDVTDGVLVAFDAGGDVLLETAVRDFDAAGLRGCHECADFLGEAADISAGSVASEDGYTTIVVRSDRGKRAWECATSGLESIRLEETDTLSDLSAWNERRARDALAREYDPQADLGITYEHHRESYDGTDREPKPLNPARVHQYEEWC